MTLSVSTQDIEMIIPYHVFEATKQAIYERNLFIIQRKDNSTPSKKEVCARTALTRTGFLVTLCMGHNYKITCLVAQTTAYISSAARFDQNNTVEKKVTSAKATTVPP